MLPEKWFLLEFLTNQKVFRIAGDGTWIENGISLYRAFDTMVNESYHAANASFHIKIERDGRSAPGGCLLLVDSSVSKLSLCLLLPRKFQVVTSLKRKNQFSRS